MNVSRVIFILYRIQIPRNTQFIQDGFNCDSWRTACITCEVIQVAICAFFNVMLITDKIVAVVFCVSAIITLWCFWFSPPAEEAAWSAPCCRCRALSTCWREDGPPGGLFRRLVLSRLLLNNSSAAETCPRLTGSTELALPRPSFSSFTLASPQMPFLCQLERSG